MEKPHRLTVGGEVYDTRMFGPSYRLRTEISTKPGDTQFEIADQITNLGGVPAELELLYHCNYGPPVLGEGARLVAPVKKVSARDDGGLADMDRWDLYGPPQPGFVEQCYFLTLHGDGKGNSTVALVSPDEDLAAAVEFSVRRLPAFTLWKNTAAEADGYVTGLEPGTDYPNPRQFEREQGRVLTLDPGESYEAGVKLGLARGKSDVKKLCSKIKGIAKGKKSEVCEAVDPALSSAV